MAKDTKNTAPVMAQNQTAAPEGWEQEQTGFPPYWTPEEGATFRGTVIEFDPDTENDGGFPRFTLVSSGPLLCHQGPVDDQIEIMIKQGDRFNVSQYASLPLEEYLGFEVWAKAVSKRPISGGKSVWVFDLRVAPETKRLVAERQAKQLQAATTALAST